MPASSSTPWASCHRKAQRSKILRCAINIKDTFFPLYSHSSCWNCVSIVPTVFYLIRFGITTQAFLVPSELSIVPENSLWNIFFKFFPVGIFSMPCQAVVKALTISSTHPHSLKKHIYTSTLGTVVDYPTPFCPFNNLLSPLIVLAIAKWNFGQLEVSTEFPSRRSFKCT